MPGRRGIRVTSDQVKAVRADLLKADAEEDDSGTPLYRGPITRAVPLIRQ